MTTTKCCEKCEGHGMGTVYCKYEGCTCHTNTSEWERELENLALTEPDPNKAVYNLPSLKAFIRKHLTLAEQRGREEAVAHVAKHIIDKEQFGGKLTEWVKDYLRVLMEARALPTEPTTEV